MKKFINKSGKIVLLVMILIMVVLTFSYINHRIQLSKEDALFVPIGQQLEVNGHMINIYSEGTGATTLVFLSGGGTCSPVLDFKSLYSILSEEYRIVVVEKAGYGFSSVADITRDLDSVLSDTRQALELAGIQGPFVLCPHSMSGIESIYWAQSYPEEVSAIIGLDMAVPETYEDFQLNMPMIQLGKLAADLGITRFIPGVSDSDAIKYGTLTEDEKSLYKVIFYRRTATINMINEVKEIKTSAKKVESLGIPSTPVLMFSSNGQGTGWDQEEWQKFQSNYIEKAENGTLIKLDCSHYVHDIEYEKIAEEIKTYLEDLNELKID